jgi:hypothetical protein
MAETGLGKGAGIGPGFGDDRTVAKVCRQRCDRMRLRCPFAAAGASKQQQHQQWLLSPIGTTERRITHICVPIVMSAPFSL